MFGSKFSHLQFSLNKATTDIPVRIFFRDTLNNMSGFGADIPVYTDLKDNLRADLTLTMSIPSSFIVENEMHATSNGTINLIVSTDFQEGVNCKAQIAEDLYIKTIFEDDVKVRAYLGKDTPVYLDALSEMLEKVSIVKNIVTRVNATEIVNCILDANILENETITIEVSIPPGGELQIDSDMFNAYLNNKNVLHLQKGDWITIDRNTVSLRVDSGTGGKLDGKILYNERYL